MGLSIEIDGWDPTKKYFGGDLITGNVVITNKSSHSKYLSKDLVIRFTGKAEVHWKAPRKNVDHRHQYLITTTETETYFDTTIKLQDKLSEGSVRSGVSTFPFQFLLPQGIPQSFSGSQGSLKYWVEVEGYPGGWIPGKKPQQELPIGGLLDLNVIPTEWTLPAEFYMEKSFWFGSGKVEALLSIPKRCFVPMENVTFTVEVSNHSGCYLKKIRVYFCQVTCYHAKGSVWKEGARLSKMKCKPVHPKGTATIEGCIVVPEVAPTNLGGCALIQPQYGIMIKVIATTMGKIFKSAVLEGRIPIVVGTVPLGTGGSASAGESRRRAGMAEGTLLDGGLGKRRVILTSQRSPKFGFDVEETFTDLFTD